MVQKSCFQQIFHIWPWSVTLVLFDLATWFLCTAHCLMMVNIIFNSYNLMMGLWTRQAALGLFIRLCDLDLWVTDLGLKHGASTQCVTHLFQVISKSIKNDKSYGADKLFFNHIWPWSVTLTLDLATQVFHTAHNLMMVNICVKLYQIPAWRSYGPYKLFYHIWP